MCAWLAKYRLCRSFKTCRLRVFHSRWLLHNKASLKCLLFLSSTNIQRNFFYLSYFPNSHHYPSDKLHPFSKASPTSLTKAKSNFQSAHLFLLTHFKKRILRIVIKVEIWTQGFVAYCFQMITSTSWQEEMHSTAP